MSFIARSGADLQAARKAAAERFTAIAMQYVPEGWEVVYRKSLSGYCSYGKRLSVPRPVTRKSLYIFLHECAHAHLHYPLWVAGNETKRKLPLAHVREMEAEKWAHDKMREHGVAVPRSMTHRAKRYVARKIKQARRSGAKRIDSEARRFAFG